MYNVAPKNGMKIAMIAPGTITTPLIRKVKFDAREFVEALLQGTDGLKRVMPGRLVAGSEFPDDAVAEEKPAAKGGKSKA